MKAIVLAAKDSPLSKLDELKGKSLAWPKNTPQHLKFFLRREFGQPVDQAFKVQPTRNVDEALEDVIEGKADFACVGQGQAKVFQDQKPGRYNRLKVVAESADFPPPVVAYQSKGADPLKISRFADAMLRANQTTEGKQTLTLWRLKGFERLPKDYDAMLDAIVKKYPMQ